MTPYLKTLQENKELTERVEELEDEVIQLKKEIQNLKARKHKDAFGFFEMEMTPHFPKLREDR